MHCFTALLSCAKGRSSGSLGYVCCLKTFLTRNARSSIKCFSLDFAQENNLFKNNQVVYYVHYFNLRRATICLKFDIYFLIGRHCLH